jgi:hypothetical protein
MKVRLGGAAACSWTRCLTSACTGAAAAQFAWFLVVPFGGPVMPALGVSPAPYDGGTLIKEVNKC